MTARDLLSRLDGVRRTALDRWVARCPAHEDRRPSLSIRELNDGRTLIHCFAECPVDAVLAAIGLDLCTLYPERPEAHAAKGVRRPFQAQDILRAVATEVAVVAIIASNLKEGNALTDGDHQRLWLAAGRLKAAADYTHGGYRGR